MSIIENHPFDELKVGDSASLVRTLDQRDIKLFAVMSGDVNPAHVDEEYARSDMFHKVIAHGMWGGTLISTALGTLLPGPGTIYLGQSLQFLHPVALGDTVTVTVKIEELNPVNHWVKLGCQVTNQNHQQVMAGVSEVIAPTEKISRPRVELPEVRLHEKGRHHRALIAQAQRFTPVRTAVVHPVDSASLMAAIEAARAGLIVPVLVGPETKIRQAAGGAGIDLAGVRIVTTPHSHAAAASAAGLARMGEVQALMKGVLDMDELMQALAGTEADLRTERRISHVSVMDAPAYSRPLLVTDATINVYPDLLDKRDIVQNAIDLAHALGLATPRVAMLAARETVDPRLRSTTEAASLCKMAERRQIGGAILDGPLSFDSALSEEAAKSGGLSSPVAGKADILVVPDLEVGNTLTRQLRYFAEAQEAGIILGARVPIIFPNQPDSALASLASCALATLLVGHRIPEQAGGAPEQDKTT